MWGVRPRHESESTRRYFVVFTQGPWHWWDWFFKRGYCHCYLLIWDDPLWLCVEPTMQITQVFTIPKYEWCDPFTMLGDPNAKIVETWLRCDETMRTPWVWSPVTCTEIVKSILGIRAFWMWTPWQLAKYLRRDNG